MLKIYHWVIIALALIATVVAWQLSLISVQERTQAEFDRQADSTIKLFQHELDRYADVLRSATGFVVGSEGVTQSKWHSFNQQIHFEEQYPGLGALAVVYQVLRDDVERFVEQQRILKPDFNIRPEYKPNAAESNPFVMALSLVYPESFERMIGFDFSYEKVRLEGMSRAMRAGEVQITAPVELDGSDVKGFVLVAPIYSAIDPMTEKEREASFVGVIVGATVVSDLVESVLGSTVRQVAFSVADGDDILYNELDSDSDNIDANPLLTTTTNVSSFGRDWRFNVHTTNAFREAQLDVTPSLVLLGGLIFDAMLILFLAHVVRANERLDEYGKDLSKKYKLQSVALEERNKQLETFSHMASHDLKGPLTSIGFLAECIQVDLKEQDGSLNANEDISDHVKRINGQVSLGKGLIKGILQYSEIGSKAGALRARNIDVRDMLSSLKNTLRIEESQLKFKGDLPVFDTYESQLTQVFLNLVSNGFKYHHGEGIAEVTVGMAKSPLPDYYRFTVSDNGPGISPEYHQRVFEPFATLQPKDHSLSSGIGLAIVKKLVAEHGGSIEIDSVEGQGTSFSFDWPRFVDESYGVGDSSLPKAA